MSADFRHITDEGLVCVFMRNERGSRIGGRYLDSQGTELIAPKIGAWNGTIVEWATLSVLDIELGFRLWGKKTSILRRWREFLQVSLERVGLDCEIPLGNCVFDYLIEILGCKQG